LVRQRLLEKPMFKQLFLWNVSEHFSCFVKTLQEPHGVFLFQGFYLENVYKLRPGQDKVINVVDDYYDLQMEGFRVKLQQEVAEVLHVVLKKRV
jgi:hypothetical protein